MCSAGPELLICVRRSGKRPTLSTISIIDSSVDEASLRMARNAAILTLSSPLDHSSKQIFRGPVISTHILKSQVAHLQICPDSLPTANNIWDNLRTLRDCKL